MLKNILSLLLSKFYSKKESEAVGHQATPSDSYVDFTLSKTETSSLGSTEEILNAIAPCDGYLFVRGRSLTDSHRLLLSTRAGMYINAYGKTITTQGTVVVFKGENISVSAVSMTDLKVRLYKFVGSVSGGVSTLKKLLLQGGGLCRLSHWYSSLRRNSWLARRRVFRTGRTPISQIVLPFSFHLQKTILFIHLQATDGCRCTLGTRGLLTSQLILTQRIIAQSCLAFCLPFPVGTATFIEYVKELMSRSQLQLLYRKDGLCFFRLINSAVGGASC